MSHIFFQVFIMEHNLSQGNYVVFFTQRSMRILCNGQESVDPSFIFFIKNLYGQKMTENYPISVE